MLNISYKRMKFSGAIEHIVMERSKSQISDFGTSINSMTKNGKIRVIFPEKNFYIQSNSNQCIHKKI